MMRNYEQIRKAYLKAFAAADNLALNITESLGCIEHFRDGSVEETVSWGDVGMMNRFAEKLNEILEEIEQYEQHCTTDGYERVSGRKLRRAVNEVRNDPV